MKGQYQRVLQRYEKMKNMKKKVANAVIGLAKHGVKNDINSTGSGWNYQPRIPAAADKYKKN